MADWFEKRRIGDLPARAAARWGDRESLVAGDRRYTHADVDREVDRVARGLIGLGVGAGDHVALWMTNCPEFLFVTYAVAKIGAVLVPLNTRYRTADVGYTVAQSDSAVLVVIDRSGPVDYRAMVAEMLAGGEVAGGMVSHPGFPALRRVIFLGDALPGTLDWNALLTAGDTVDAAALARRAEAVDPDAPWVIGYTSGTTGHPKGALHSHICIRNVAERCLAWGHDWRDVHMSYLPLFHLYGLSEAALAAIWTGASQILMPTFEGERAIRLIEAERATVLHGFDTHYADLMAAKRRTGADTSSLRIGTFPSGVANSIPVARRSQAELCTTVSGFGMTETWAFITISRLCDSEEVRCDASGVPLIDIDVQVVDPETGAVQPPEMSGEIRVKSYMNTRGYYNKPEATAELFDDRGRLKTGDTGFLRPDGSLRFVGRYKDMLKVGGENVAPMEVEAFLMALPGVGQVAVVGRPDERLQEVPVAFVVPVEGSNVTAASIIESCRGRIASYKIPRDVYFVDLLPMTASGKVQKFRLREQIAGMNR